MLGYELEEERPREERPPARAYDTEDEPVDVEGDSLGWPDAAINVDGTIAIICNTFPLFLEASGVPLAKISHPANKINMDAF